MVRPHWKAHRLASPGHAASTARRRTQKLTTTRPIHTNRIPPTRRDRITAHPQPSPPPAPTPSDAPAPHAPAPPHPAPPHPPRAAPRHRAPSPPSPGSPLAHSSSSCPGQSVATSAPVVANFKPFHAYVNTPARPATYRSSGTPLHAMPPPAPGTPHGLSLQPDTSLARDAYNGAGYTASPYPTQSRTQPKPPNIVDNYITPTTS